MLSIELSPFQPPEEVDEAAELHHVAQKAYAEGRYKDALNSLLKERREFPLLRKYAVKFCES